MKRLKASEVGPFRDQALATNGHLCALCKEPITSTDRVHLDHNHVSGVVRGAIHAGCNVTLCKLENAARRYGVNLSSFLLGAYAYQRGSMDVLHPTFHTKEEKAALAKKRRQRKAKLAKAAQ